MPYPSKISDPYKDAPYPEIARFMRREFDKMAKLHGFNFTQVQFSKILDLSQSVVSDLMNGLVMPTHRTQDRVAAVLGREFYEVCNPQTPGYYVPPKYRPLFEKLAENLHLLTEDELKDLVQKYDDMVARHKERIDHYGASRA